MERKVASPVKRLVGYLIDSAIGVGPFAYFAYLTATSRTIYVGLDNAMVGLTISFFWATLYPIINAYLTSKLGGTIGKMVVNTKVVDANGRMISFKKALFRNYIGYIVSGTIAYLGFIWILVDKKNHRAWHDMTADTFVLSMK